MSKITITNVSTSPILITVPDIKFRRELVPGRSIPVTQEVYEELMFDTGVNNLIRGHFLKIEGLEEEEESVIEENIVDAATIEKMLEKEDITAFAKFIPNAAPAEKEAVIKYAVEKGVTNNAFTALIKKYCGVDVISAINTKHLAEE